MADPSLTVENMCKVVEGVGEWKGVGMLLSVPDTILDKIAVKYPSVNERTSALASYTVNTLPSITWEDIAAALYSWDEERAVERVKLYLQRFDG